MYLHRFIYSARNAGYRGAIKVLTTDDDIYCNNRVDKVEQGYTTEIFPDSRWIKLELDRHFREGDRVIFLDSDIVVTSKFPFNKLFKKDLFITTVPLTHDTSKAAPKIKEIMEIDIKTKYLASPIGFLLNDKAREFFKLWRMMRPFARLYNLGTMFALNIACHMRGMKDFYIVPENRCGYTMDVVLNTPRRAKKPYLFHYGGRLGKDIWMEEYR